MVKINAYKWSVGIIITLAILSIIITSVIGMFSFVDFGISMFFVVFFFISWSILKYSADYKEKNDEENQKEKMTLDECWKAANEILSRMPEGRTLQWERGFGRISKVRSYKKDNAWIAYRSLAGRTSDHQMAIVVYNITDRDISLFSANPLPEEFKDPFTNFKPFGEAEYSDNMMDLIGRKRGRRRDYKNNYPKKRESIFPSADMVDRAFQNE